VSYRTNTGSGGFSSEAAVAEAAPGNPGFIGGRWIAYTAWWTDQGFADHGTVAVITSSDEFVVHYMLGRLGFALGHPAGALAPRSMHFLFFTPGVPRRWRGGIGVLPG